MEPTGHCPFVGLKQNRAIRFSSPTPEHRCYVGGDPIEIPVDQSEFCLSHNHTQCPLYMGLTPVTTSETTIPLPVTGTAAQPANGFGGWLAGLSPRDRLIYLLMISLLGLILLVYVAAGLQSLSGMPQIGSVPTAQTVAPTQPDISPVVGAILQTAAARTATAAAVSAAPTEPRATPTALPTSTPSPQPTDEPTQPPVYFPPTATLSVSSPIPATSTTAVGSPVVPSSTVAPSVTAAGPSPSVPAASPTAQLQPTLQSLATAQPQT